MPASSHAHQPIDFSSGRLPAVTVKETRRGARIAFLAWTLAVYDYILFGTLLPRISEDFGWDTTQALFISTLISIGTFVVIIAVGPVIDRMGRRSGMMLTVGGTALSSLATAFTAGAASLIGIRSISGLGLAEQAVNATYLKEVFDLTEDETIKKRKGLVYSFVQSGWPAGALLAAGFVAVINAFAGQGEWRWIFALASLPAILVFIIRRGLKETPQFRLQQHLRKLHKEGRSAEAQEIAARFGLSTEAKSGFARIFAPEYRRNTVALMLSWVLNYFGVYAFSFLSTTVLESVKGIDAQTALVVVVLSNLVAIAGYVFHGWLGDRIGRKKVIVGGWAVAGFAFAALILGPSSVGFVLVAFMAGMFFLLGPYAALMFYQAECYGPECRATGSTFLTSMGQPGVMLAGVLLTAMTAAAVSLGTAVLVVGALGTLLSGIAVAFTKAPVSAGGTASANRPDKLATTAP